MRVVLITGMSGSGKSVAIRLLEDLGYYCIDNLPPRFLAEVCAYLNEAGHTEVAVSVDARTELSLGRLPILIESLRSAGHDVRVLFLTASTAALVQRYSESRRRHPLSERLALGVEGLEATLTESIEAERDLLAPMNSIGHLIDTSALQPNTLRNWVQQFADSPRAALTLTFESFAYKGGIPVDADLVFDVRNLPNPFYDPLLKPLTGLDAPVIAFLSESRRVAEMTEDIAGFLEKWLPGYVQDTRHYVTVAIGCTGGQHRSVYVVEQLSKRFTGRGRVLVRHRAIAHR
jgi:UPF0042 nucleotide-binding protein